MAMPSMMLMTFKTSEKTDVSDLVVTYRLKKNTKQAGLLFHGFIMLFSELCFIQILKIYLLAQD